MKIVVPTRIIAKKHLEITHLTSIAVSYHSVIATVVNCSCLLNDCDWIFPKNNRPTRATSPFIHHLFYLIHKKL